MPRLTIEGGNDNAIEYICDQYDQLGMGSDSFDLCAQCSPSFEGWELFMDSVNVPSWLEPSITIPRDTPFVLALTDSPPYDDFEYECAECGRVLTDEDD